MANHGPWCDCAACEADRVPLDQETERGPRRSISMPSERDRVTGRTDMRVELRGADGDEIKAAFASLLDNMGWSK